MFNAITKLSPANHALNALAELVDHSIGFIPYKDDVRKFCGDDHTEIWLTVCPYGQTFTEIVGLLTFNNFERGMGAIIDFDYGWKEEKYAEYPVIMLRKDDKERKQSAYIHIEVEI